MKAMLIRSLLVSVLLGSVGYAGGKVVAPADTGVIPVSEETSAWYLGIGLVATKFRACHDECDYEDLTYGAMLRGGYELNEYFGIEARAIRTFLDEGLYGGVPLQHIGIYAKSQYPASERLNIYGLLRLFSQTSSFNPTGIGGDSDTTPSPGSGYGKELPYRNSRKISQHQQRCSTNAHL